MKNLQIRHTNDAFMHLRSLQFCSVNKLEKLQIEKESQLKALENDLTQKLNQVKQQEQIKVDKMQDAIKQL